MLSEDLNMNGDERHRDVLSVSTGKQPGPHGSVCYGMSAIGLWISERISLCTLYHSGKRFTKASLTVEAALAVPLFWCAMSGFLYLLLLFRLQEDVSQALADAGRKFSEYAYEMDLEAESDWAEIGLLLAKKELREHCTDSAALRLVKDGVKGISLWKSNIMEEDAVVQMVASYEISLPFRVLGFGTIRVEQTQLCRAWIGFTGRKEEDSGERTVYITPYGERYHESMACRYLALNIEPVEKGQLEQARNESGECYAACESCWKGTKDALLYITKYGNRYHEDLDCIGLKRTVSMVLLSQVGERTPCQGCYGRS